MVNNFWENIEKYRKLGFDPLRWIPTCSNEVDYWVLQKALQEIKRSSIKISPSWFDSFFYMDGKTPELTRRVYSFSNPVIDKEAELKRAAAIFRVHTGIGEEPSLLSEALQNFLKVFQAKVSISRASVALTEHPDAQFALFDYIELHRGDKVGYMPVNTSAIQMTDVTQSPDSEIHSNIAMTAAIENLVLLGCGQSSSFKLFPVYDAPSEEMLDRIRSNLDSFTSRYNLAMEDYSSVKQNKLFYGASAFASTLKELPTKYDQVEEGMEIILTKKFGALPAMSLYMLAQMDQANAEKFERADVSMQDIAAAKEEVVKNLSEPHFALGKIVSKYCPDFGSAFDKSAHITAVHPVGADGIFAAAKLAVVTNSSIIINELPVRHEEIAKLATKEFLVENATSSANGCHLIVATKDVANLVEDDLKKHNFEPARIGSVAKKGTAAVTVNKDLGQFVASKARIAKLGSLAAQVQ